MAVSTMLFDRTIQALLQATAGVTQEDLNLGSREITLKSGGVLLADDNAPPGMPGYATARGGIIPPAFFIESEISLTQEQVDGSIARQEAFNAIAFAPDAVQAFLARYFSEGWEDRIRFHEDHADMLKIILPLHEREAELRGFFETGADAGTQSIQPRFDQAQFSVPEMAVVDGVLKFRHPALIAAVACFGQAMSDYCEALQSAVDVRMLTQPLTNPHAPAYINQTMGRARDAFHVNPQMFFKFIPAVLRAHAMRGGVTDGANGPAPADLETFWSRAASTPMATLDEVDFTAGFAMMNRMGAFIHHHAPDTVGEGAVKGRCPFRQAVTDASATPVSPGGKVPEAGRLLYAIYDRLVQTGKTDVILRAAAQEMYDRLWQNTGPARDADVPLGGTKP